MTKSPKNSPPDLTIVIVNYNTGAYLAQCLTSLAASRLKNYQVTVLVADNASTDTSFTDAQKLGSRLASINPSFYALPKNIGFSQGNNAALTHLDPDSRYVLFLNPDTTVERDTLARLITYFDTHPQVDAATANVILVRTGRTQPESHRGFPTPLNSFFHFFLPFLPRLFPKSALFNGYFSGHLDLSQPSLIDACVGACLMVKTKVGAAVGWWCPDYFFYGEDLDFCFQLKKQGYQLWFLPDIQIYHYQGVSSGIKNKSSNASLSTRLATARASTRAMRLFYQRNLYHSYPPLFRFLVGQGINLLEITRLARARLK